MTDPRTYTPEQTRAFLHALDNGMTRGEAHAVAEYEVYLIRASDLEPEEVEYLDPRFPLRVITLVTGVDGVGKSTMLYWIAARASLGTLEGAFKGEPVNVVVASAEDHAQSVILPRLVAAGADLARVHIVKVRRSGFDGEMSLPDDIPAVARKVAEVGARLVIIDPLVAHMPLHVDTHKAQHIRSVLAPLARMAEDRRASVAAVVHFNGSPSTDVRSRISGSKALRDASRSVLVCGIHPDDESRYVMIQDKNSMGPKPAHGWSYRVSGTVVSLKGKSYVTSVLTWGEVLAISSHSLLGGGIDPDDRTEQDIAADIILDALLGAPMTWVDLGKLLHTEGITVRTGRRGRDRLKRDGLIDRKKRGRRSGIGRPLRRLRRRANPT